MGGLSSWRPLNYMTAVILFIKEAHCMSMLTFADLALAYLSIHLKHRSTQAEYFALYRRHFDNETWAAQLLSDISRFQVMELNQGMAGSPDYGNKVVGFITRVYAWGQNTINPETRRPYWEGSNPAWRIKRHECLSRERVMDQVELSWLLQSLDGLCLKYQAFFCSRLLVPCRIRELCGMRRDAVTERGKWTKKFTKTGRPHYIYVARQAMDLLSLLPVDGDYFFMGHYGRPLSEDAARKIWAKWRAELGLHDLWLLDFRRTLATYLYRILKVDDLTAKAVLNHYDGRPVAIYVRLDYDYLATILQSYADWVWQLKQPAMSRPPLICATE